MLSGNGPPMWTCLQRDQDLLLGSAPLLAHYDSYLPLVVTCDASPYGVASVLSHRYEDGSECPIAYASRTLTESEKNYAQINSEVLAVVFGVKRFNEYLFGKSFILVTDNRPLTHIFAPSRCTPNVAATRIQRWTVYLGAHKYTIEHRPAMKHTNVDGLSRLPSPAKTSDTDPVEIFHVSQMEILPVTSKDIADKTKKDSILSRVYHYTLNGWEMLNQMRNYNPIITTD